MAKYGMAISLDRCVGCGVCALACKTENNTEMKQGGTTYNWADFLLEEVGTYATGDFSFRVYPTLCNHCTDAPCVNICPTTPKAMYKTTDGITMHNESDCIGCQQCQTACPYSTQDVDTDNKQYSVISFNPDGANTQTFWDDTTEMITGCTSNPDETRTLAGATPPDQNVYSHSDYSDVRPVKNTEKCIFCDHRVQLGEQPYCVESCPTQARTFGDLDDQNSEISQLLMTYGYHRLKNNSGSWLQGNEAGTDPNVYYLGKYGAGPGTKDEEITETTNSAVSLYPNPASSNATVNLEMESASKVSLSIYDIEGKEVMKVLNNEHKAAGKHTVRINVNRLAAGTYICRFQTADNVASVNFVVTR